MQDSKQTNRAVIASSSLPGAWLMSLLLAMVLIVGQSTLLLAAEQGQAMPAMPAMPVETLEVRVETAEQQLSAVGSLQANESVLISSEIAGRIETIDFDEGQPGRKGQLLVQLDDAVLRAQLDQAKANLELHEADYRRAEALLQDRAISQQERDTAYARWTLDKASVRLAKAQLDKARIIAPFSGRLGLRQVSPGDYVQPGQQLVNLEQTERLKVEFRIPEKYAAQVNLGQPLRLQTDAFAGREFSGRVYAIDPQVEERSRSLVVRGQLDNRDGLLRPGQFVQVRLTVATRADALFIPEQALIPQPQTNLVFKVIEGKAQMVPVQIGQRRKGWVEITSGLSAGDLVVTGGQQKIGPGSPVQPLPADPALFAKM